MKKTKSDNKKINISKIKVQLWNECKRIVRAKYMNKDGTWTCYTCNKTLIYPKDIHTAHGKSKGSLSIKYKYDLRNLKCCCYNCNINLGGATDIFLAKLEKEKEGLEFLKETCIKDEFGAWRLKHDDCLIQSKYFLPQLLEEYKLL